MSIAQLDLLVSLRGRKYELLMLDNALLSVGIYPPGRPKSQTAFNDIF